MNLKRNFTSEAELRSILDFIYDQSRKGKSFHGIMEVAFNKVTIIKAILTHSQWLKCPFNQNMTPYTDSGRKLYQKQSHKVLPLNRPPLYDNKTLKYSKDDTLNNFEYYMNREYAYNRDKGKCKICGKKLNPKNRHCHRLDGKLQLEQINKIPNHVWICKICDNDVHSETLPNAEKKIIKRIQKFQLKL